MADSNQNSNNSQSAQQNNQSNTQNSNNSNAAAINSGWVTVNTSDSISAQRMSIMKGDENILITKGDR